MGAQSHVKVSFEIPEYTTNINALGTLRILEIIKNLRFKKNIKFYQASTSELFGNTKKIPQNEKTPFYPRSPYACSKLFAHWITINYREAYNIFAANGILFNHESPRRGTNFVTNKVVKEAVKIKLGLSSQLKLGNLGTTRDWGHAKDYVEAMWLILQQDQSDDFVCSTGISHSVKELCEYVFNKLDLNYLDYVVKSEKFLRPEELNNLKGDSSKLIEKTGWKPKYTFETMLDEMVEYWILKLQINK